MNKKKLFIYPQTISENEKYFLFQNTFWKVNSDKTIHTGKNIISWESFYQQYNNLADTDKIILEKEIIKKSKPIEYKTTRFLKILINTSKQNNFYNILKKESTIPKLNAVIISYYYHQTYNDDAYSTKQLLDNVIYNSPSTADLFFKLTDVNTIHLFNQNMYNLIQNDIVKYLKDNEIYDKFEKMIADAYNKEIHSFNDYYAFRKLNDYDIANLLLLAITWSKTIPERIFWRHQHQEIQKFIIKLLMLPID